MRPPAPATPSANLAPDGLEVASHVHASLPPGGLFADQHWRVATAPFLVPPDVADTLESLGRVLHQFCRALQLLYRRSVEGKSPAWIAELLDRGKPRELVELQRDTVFRNEVPRVLRPDLLLTESGLAMTELDSVPGGIGLTTWLYESYASAVKVGSSPNAHAAWQFLGNASAMLDGFRGIFLPAERVHIVVSEESASYRPEMSWLASRIQGAAVAVQDVQFQEWRDGDAVYRFFELFDTANVPSAARLFADAKARKIRLTPPPKPLFEEKLGLALLWNRNLRSFWRQELGEGFFRRLQEITPYTWVMDPSPLPPHAAYPEIHLTEWAQLKELSQRDRNLILKISGFSELAWGARGVHYGADMSASDWAESVDEAIRSWPTAPYILQRYHKPRSVPAAWADFESNAVIPMDARVRLCPYYFLHGEGDAARPKLGGVLATLCPSDKKIIHGMRDAILAPCAVADHGTRSTR